MAMPPANAQPPKRFADLGSFSINETARPIDGFYPSPSPAPSTPPTVA
jgi:hypothetical protein